MSKYESLADFLRAQDQDSIRLEFAQIDMLVNGLPPSARNHDAWWANSRTADKHSWAHLWIAAGWECGTVDRANEVVVFQRTVNNAVAAMKRYWWVNHKQTYHSEIEGGYIWSPTKNQNGARNQTYINLTLVRPGDVVVSYAGGEVRAIGVATSSYKDQPKPEAFGLAGQNWSDTGWLVSVEWSVLEHPVSPKVYLADIVNLLPTKNSPLQTNGNGNQGCYLASISPEFGAFMLALARAADLAVIERVAELEEQLEADEIEHEIKNNESVPSTEREQLVRARVGQGAFRLHALDIEKACRLTGVRDERFLIASHIKPWNVCSNIERLDGHNGLLLAPHVDKLFDRGWISFTDSGVLLVASSAPSAVMEAWGLSVGRNVGSFSAKQKAYLQYHRTNVFRGAVEQFSI